MNWTYILIIRSGSPHEVHLTGAPQPELAVAAMRGMGKTFPIVLETEHLLVRWSRADLQIFIHPDLIEGGT